MATAIEERRHPETVPARAEVGLFTNPFLAMRRLSDEMEHLFGDFWGPHRVPSLWRETGFGARWTPNIEMFERKGELVVRADLPGLTKEDVKVEITDNELVIEGERKEEKERKEQGYYACERSYGSFYRAVALPEGVNFGEAKATFKEGVLEITMPAPKVPEKHGRRLEVKT
jgi:HSP20 family protein